MADRPKPSEKDLREQRLQAALRENLKRRKRASARPGRKPRETAEPHDSAGFAADKENG